MLAKIIQVAQRGLKQPVRKSILQSPYPSSLAPVLTKVIQAPLQSYPHTVPQTGPNAGRYEEREASFWTCGFFPGCIYALLERSIKYPQAVSLPAALRPGIQEHLLKLGRHYSVAIRDMSSRTDTHDMGFIVQPALQRDWELTGNKDSLACVVNAAEALASRYDERVKAIRSWDVAVNDRYSLTDMQENFLVIIDSMCSMFLFSFFLYSDFPVCIVILLLLLLLLLLHIHIPPLLTIPLLTIPHLDLDLLYFAAHHTASPHLAHIATTHANSIISEILRPDYSSYHLVNFDPHTGLPQSKLTNQGHADASTWSRGQAWAIMGFAQTYMWTRDTRFLATAMRCAEYFLARCAEGRGNWACSLVPRWDFDAPLDAEHDAASPLRDVSAGVIAANGFLILHQALQGVSAPVAAQMAAPGQTSTPDFLAVALETVAQTLELAYDGTLASFRVPAKTVAPSNGHANGVVAVDKEQQQQQQQFLVDESPFDAILRHSTTNWNEHAHQKYKDHGLVYADYYLLEFGNQLLRAGLI